MNEVCIFKLINGDEVVGRLQGEDENAVYVGKPLVVEETTDLTTGTSNVLLTNYIPFGKNDSITFSKFHVIGVLPVTAQVERYYENSLLYNEKYVLDSVETRLKVVNENMERNLSAPEEVVKPKKIAVKGSKSIH